ncbi:hypothetical protein [Pseudotabrizicola sp. 4114]|uniref:hypothetical protein n=1 Tax=Pseudotabrizicola sp. 4114 TaxID=2817731 RepID=UPI00285B6248|nr:hypothetical protein [Pseudorhodobacter sp. 4114]
MIRPVGLFCAVLGFATPVQAMEADEFSRLLSEAVSGVTMARVYAETCASRTPDLVTAQRDAMAGWAFRVDLDGYDRLMQAAVRAQDGLAADLEAHDKVLREAIAGDIDTDDSMCQDFATWLEDDRFDLRSHIRDLLRNAGDFGFVVADPAPSSDTPGEVEVLDLGTLSAQALAEMETVGSRAGAESNRDLRKAREEHLLAWLRGRGMLVAYGRITAADEMREWRGDRQSQFMVDCRSFEPGHEDIMAGKIGEDMVVVGEPRWVSEREDSGVIGLRDCSLFRLEETGMALTQGDDTSGLMPRPPAFDEIYAGPDAGIAAGDIDRVLYAAEFTNRMDGFGNGYTDRREDIYVLLRDGTAYRHAWDFPFTDINVDLSRDREPDRWFTWTDRRGKASVAPTGGPDPGEEVDLSEARRLRPAAPAQRFDGTYYYLNVGMGGARRDLEYVFAPDGTVTFTRGGFVAGNFGTSYIIVSPGEDVSRLAYRFDGFAMVIEGPDGSERHFFAMMEDDDTDRPAEVLINGKVYWVRDDE